MDLSIVEVDKAIEYRDKTSSPIPSRNQCSIDIWYLLLAFRDVKATYLEDIVEVCASIL